MATGLSPVPAIPVKMAAIVLPADQAPAFFNDLVGAGISPIGLGARDTLRLEAGMNLYGQDIHLSVSPLYANMAWTIAWEPASRKFVGREALEAEKADGVQLKLVGLVLEERGVCVLTKLFASPMLAKGRSPVVVSLLRLASRLHWRACRWQLPTAQEVVPRIPGPSGQTDLRTLLPSSTLIRRRTFMGFLAGHRIDHRVQLNAIESPPAVLSEAKLNTSDRSIIC